MENLHQSRKGGGGGNKWPPYLSAGATWLGQEGKDARALVLEKMPEIDKEDVDDGKGAEIEEWEMRKWANERAAKSICLMRTREGVEEEGGVGRLK